MSFAARQLCRFFRVRQRLRERQRGGKNRKTQRFKLASWLSFAFFFPYRALAKLSHIPNA
jgi:hypothetical protein